MVRCRRLGTEEFWNLGAAVSRDCFGWVGVPFEGSMRGTGTGELLHAGRYSFLT